MLKNTFLILAILFATSVVSYAQDTPAVTKNISFYMCGSSGNFNPDAGDMLDSWSEMGVSYSQNFANAQWLTVTATAAICTANSGFLKKPGSDELAGAAPHNLDVTGYGQVYFSFFNYATIGVQTEGRIDIDLKYKVALPANQSLTFRQFMWLHPTGSPFYATLANPTGFEDDEDGNPDPDKPIHTRNVVDHLDYRIVYSVGFHPEWSFSSDLRFRFSGNVAKGSTAKADSPQALRESFNIRWNNTISYSNANGLGGYFTFRYQPNKILVKTEHTISVLAGISYSYDLSAL